MELFLFLGSLFVFLCFGIPIAMVLVLCAMVLMFHADMWDPMTIASCMLDGANNYPLMAIPFFVFAGEIMAAGGLSKRVVQFAQLSRLRGHLQPVVDALVVVDIRALELRVGQFPRLCVADGLSLAPLVNLSVTVAAHPSRVIVRPRLVQSQHGIHIGMEADRCGYLPVTVPHRRLLSPLPIRTPPRKGRLR